MKSIPYLIIDGYNLMHAAGIARQRYGPGDLEKCRQRLQRELQSRLSASVVQRATIVYDAFDSVSNDNRVQQQQGLEIIFSPQGQDADGEIERMLLEHSVPKRVLVISSDHRLHKAATRRKARCVDAEVFWEALSGDDYSNASHSSPPPKQRPNQALPAHFKPESVEDSEHWLQQFADAETEVADDVDPQIFDADYLNELQKDLKNKRL